MIKKILAFLFYKLRAYSGYIPSRDYNKIADSYVHETVSIDDVILGGNNAISRGCTFIGEVELGKYTTIGERSILHGGKIKLGNFCQLGPNTSIYSIDHAIDYITIYNNKRLFGSELKEKSTEGKVDIGHGVWVGHGSCILKNVTIGNGSIIGAYSVVTKDIPAYSIVVGNPSRIIRKRFNESICKALDDSRWWELSSAELEPFKYLFQKRVSEFTEQDFKALSQINRIAIKG